MLGNLARHSARHPVGAGDAVCCDCTYAGLAALARVVPVPTVVSERAALAVGMAPSCPTVRSAVDPGLFRKLCSILGADWERRRRQQ